VFRIGTGGTAVSDHLDACHQAHDGARQQSSSGRLSGAGATDRPNAPGGVSGLRELSVPGDGNARDLLVLRQRRMGATG
jgi:hypothetical protein